MSVIQQVDLTKVLQALQQVLPCDRGFIPLHEPMFGDADRRYVMDCLDTGWVSSVGSYVDRFERDLADFTGARRAIAVVNGTSALHIALKMAGVVAGDEVLMPALTFVATANAVQYCGATPHLVDSTPSTLGIDVSKLEAWLQEIAIPDPAGTPFFVNRQTQARLSAIVPMHTFGHSVEMDALLDVADRWHLTIVEDAAESLGSSYKGTHTGCFGKLGALSFNGNKIITTGGGGAILTDDDVLADRIKHLTTTAKVPHRWAFEHDAVGYNYRLPNLNAALGCAQLERMTEYLQKKRALAARYIEAFQGISGLQIVQEPEHSTSNYWLNAVLFDRETASCRDRFLQLTNDAGIMTRPAWNLMHHLPMYAHCPRMSLTNAEDLERRLVNLPSSVNL